MLTRRDFLRTCGIGAGALALSGLLEACHVATHPHTGNPREGSLAWGALIGAFVQQTDTQQEPIPPDSLYALEAKLGRAFGLINVYLAWGTGFQEAINGVFPQRQLMVSLDPQVGDIPKIVAGKSDPYISQFAVAARDYGHPVYLRFGAEMNGNWNVYSAAYKGGPTAADYVLAWHRIHGIFATVGATNVRFVWCINEVDAPATAANKAESYWPGAEYVDIMGFDGFNWGSAKGEVRGQSQWRTFNQIAAVPYARLKALNASLPIWVCETGCPEATKADPSGVSKGGWFQDMFGTKLYPGIKGLVYFSADDPADKRDFRIDTTAAAAVGWKNGWLLTG
jgi:mannan endo-1,4-beta-mannosidase